MIADDRDDMPCGLERVVGKPVWGQTDTPATGPTPIDPDTGLTKMQKAWVDWYTHPEVDCNGSEAARRAGYANPGQMSHQNYANPKVQAALRVKLRDAGISRDRVMMALAQVAFKTDMADFEPLLRGQATLEQLRRAGIDTSIIESVSVTDTAFGKATKIKLHSKLKALSTMAEVLHRSGDTIITSDGGPLQVVIDASDLDALRARIRSMDPRGLTGLTVSAEPSKPVLSDDGGE